MGAVGFSVTGAGVMLQVPQVAALPSPAPPDGVDPRSLPTPVGMLILQGPS